jgi:hypothetical protein
MRATTTVFPHINSTAINELESYLYKNEIKNSSNQNNKKNLLDRKEKNEKRENLRFCVRIETKERKMNTAKDSR